MNGADLNVLPDGQLVALLAYCFEVLRSLSQSLNTILHDNETRAQQSQQQFNTIVTVEQQSQRLITDELSALQREDPLFQQSTSNIDRSIGKRHLAPLTKAEALLKVGQQFDSNNKPVSAYDVHTTDNPIITHQINQSIHEYSDVESLAHAFTLLHDNASRNLATVNTILTRKDLHYTDIKNELSLQLVEKRRREEGESVVLLSFAIM